MRGSLKSKLLVLALIVILLPLSILGLNNYLLAKKELDELGKMGIQNGTYAILDLIDELNKEVEKGVITMEEAKARVADKIIGPLKEDNKRSITNPASYGKNFYYYVMDDKGNLLVHPSLEGENLYDNQSEDGQYFIRDSIEKALNGGGYVSYNWPLPSDEAQVEPKIAYSIEDPNWGWIIVAATYERDFNKGAHTMLFTTIVTILIALLLGLVLFWYFARKMTTYLKKIMVLTSDIADGKLSGNEIPIETRDELGQLALNVNTMKNSLEEMVSQTKVSSDHMRGSSEVLSAVIEETTAAADEISHVITEISKGAVIQAEEAEVASDKVNDLSTVIEKTLKQYNEIIVGVSQMTSVQENGLSNINTLTTNTDRLQAVMDVLQATFTQLTNRMGQISQIVQTINDISAQTNLLALNASIEAARAGEHGKGFAVVAEEVRKLSEGTQVATDSVRNLLKQIEQDTRLAEIQMTETQSISNEQMDSVEYTKQSFMELTKSIQQIKEELIYLNEEMNIMYSNREVVVGAISNIAAVAEESAAATEQMNASIEEQNNAINSIMNSALQLQQEAENMHDLVSRFK
ncbi:cache domain-containing protein [Psychrobacillus sp. FSL K6-4046]|uniref:methyl-accepting chemotaxis protein n=1 Tax=Psychrobacillus sp. FSL K6-4046 TaxID=2921550 RepID=UPI00315AFFD9